MNYEFEQKTKTCLIKNETLGGLTLGLITNDYYPVQVACHSLEDRMLLEKNIPSLNLTEELDLEKWEKEVDLFSYNINQVMNPDWECEVQDLRNIIETTNFNNYFIVTNGNSVNLKREVGIKYKELGRLLEKKNKYVQIARTFYTAYGGSESRTNAFILATEHPTLSYKFKRTPLNYSAPATANYIAAIKDRNGFPKDWILDILNDDDSFLEQIRKLEKCVFPQLVSMMANTVFIG